MNTVLAFMMFWLAVGPTATAVRRAGDVHIDGRLDENAWAAATPITEFKQRAPDEGAAPTERSEIRILYDDDAIYIGARLYDRSPVETRLVRRDASTSTDLLRINIDAYHDMLTEVEFSLNPSGVRGDALDGDASWDPVWEAATSQDSLGWIAEMRIPLSQLHFSREQEQTWGLQIARVISRRNETDLWSFVPLNEQNIPAKFGTLTGLQLGHQPSHLELMPYVSGRMQRLSSDDPSSPFYDPHRSDVRVGGDIRYPITSNLTLSGTINPDFGQVEVDPAVVNLSAFETFFAEKRPFFVEGANLFSFGNPGCIMNCGFGLYPFYTRRVGRAPQATELAFREADFVDAPVTTNILAAGKVTGRTSNGTSVGILDALVGTQHAKIANPDGSVGSVVIEPRTNDFVARISQEMRGGNLQFGGIVTSVDRQLTNDALRSLFPKSGRTAGVDARMYWKQHMYSAYVAVLGSDVRGDSSAILRLQRSSARFFQRPDRNEVALDSSTTRLSGYGMIGRFAKHSGSWQYDLNAAQMSPGYETNDLGFLQTTDWRWLNFAVVRQWTKPTKWYRDFIAIGGAQSQWNYDGDVTGRDATVGIIGTFLNYWSFQAFASTAADFIDDRLTRGGPAVVRPGNEQSFQASISTDPRRRLMLDLSGNRVLDREGGFYNSISAGVTVRPASNVSISAGPDFSRGMATDQYVSQHRDPTATNFFGTRYLFASILQNTAGMTVRTQMTFTPALSFEVFAQPLIASGDYFDFAEFAAPRQRRKLTYGKDVGTITTNANGSVVIDPDGTGPAASFTQSNPDFNFRSLRGTAVLRWEWRPGSTMYLAWTQERADVQGIGDFKFGRDRSALFAAQPDNVFLIKVSYWLSR